MRHLNPLELPIINPHAAGVDVGSEKFFVSVAGQAPRVFLTVSGQMQEVCEFFRAEGVRTVEEQAGKVLDRGGDALRRADDFLQDTKEHVSDALRAGKEAIRPAPPVGEARPHDRG